MFQSPPIQTWVEFRFQIPAIPAQLLLSRHRFLLKKSPHSRNQQTYQERAPPGFSSLTNSSYTKNITKYPHEISWKMICSMLNFEFPPQNIMKIIENAWFPPRFPWDPPSSWCLRHGRLVFAPHQTLHRFLVARLERKIWGNEEVFHGLDGYLRW